MEFRVLNDLNEDIVALRNEAFVVGRGVPPEVELDGKDKGLLHFCLYDGDVLVSYLRAEEHGHYWHLGRVATRADRRMQGLGRRLMEYVFSVARKQGMAFVELGAVKTAQGFYEKLGFVTVGDDYMETGVPHIHMKKRL